MYIDLILLYNFKRILSINIIKYKLERVLRINKIFVNSQCFFYETKIRNQRTFAIFKRISSLLLSIPLIVLNNSFSAMEVGI